MANIHDLVRQAGLLPPEHLTRAASDLNRTLERMAETSQMVADRANPTLHRIADANRLMNEKLELMKTAGVVAMQPWESPPVHSAMSLGRATEYVDRLFTQQAERDELQRQQVELASAQTELLAALKEGVLQMKVDADANTERSEARFKRSHDLQLALLGLGVLTTALAIAALIVAA